MEIASGIDLSRIQELARETAAQNNVTLPEVSKPDVPDANIKLVRPHLSKLKESFALALLGLISRNTYSAVFTAMTCGLLVLTAAAAVERQRLDAAARK